MGQTAVVMDQLTPGMLQQGAELVRDLENKRVTILAAFWFLRVETGAWRLFIVTPDVDTVGPLALHRKTRICLEKHGEASEIVGYQVGIISPRDSMVPLVTGVVTTGDDFQGRRFTNAWSNGQPVDDVFVYKQTIAPPRPAGRGRRALA
jgi:hypothetical protein